MNPNVSIIIPAYNNEKTLEKTVPSILKQKYNGNVEIVLIDDNSPDNTYKIAEKFGLRLIHHTINQGLAASVNEGVKAAKHDFVCILHDDIYLSDEHWLSKLVPYLEEKTSIAGVTSPVIMPHDIWEELDLWGRMMYAWELGNHVDRVKEIEFSDGKNVLYKKDVFLGVGGYDNVTFRVACEDVDFGKRLQRKGYKILSIPVPTSHLHSPRSKGLVNIFKKNAQLAEGQGVLFREYRFIGSWNNQIFKTIALLCLFIPIPFMRAMGVLYIGGIILGYSLWAHKYMRDIRALILLPPAKLIDYLINVVCFWKGLLTGKQSI